ncbi:hypothetical protein IEQ34_007647 [Dendrobium chrysotoxum]|uniref:Uncharacterized protein n=1 Tax=Dendrobium chrysotoxum TaxID=161865 RepID=A0AAV7GMI0_DENCH|nr:hypothetical protein IEQ34_007647 [Dendrobium chrysotoxum]
MASMSMLLLGITNINTSPHKQAEEGFGNAEEFWNERDRLHVMVEKISNLEIGAAEEVLFSVKRLGPVEDLSSTEDWSYSINGLHSVMYNYNLGSHLFQHFCCNKLQYLVIFSEQYAETFKRILLWNHLILSHSCAYSSGSQEFSLYGGRMDADPRALPIIGSSQYGTLHSTSILGAPRKNIDDLIYTQGSNIAYGMSLPPGRDYMSKKGLHGYAGIDYQGNIFPHDHLNL